MKHRRFSLLAMGGWLAVCGLAFAQRPLVKPPSSVGPLATAPLGAAETAKGNVLRQLPQRVRERIERPVADAATVSFLKTRAGAFRLGGAALPLTIDAANIVDVGADVAGESRFVSAIDLEKSPNLIASIKQGTGADRATMHVTAILASHVVPTRSASEYRDTMFVSVVQKDQKRLALWRVENGRYKRLFEGTPSSTPSALTAVHAPSIGALTSSALTPTTAIAPNGDAFSTSDPPPQLSLGQECHYDGECVSAHCVVADGSFVPPSGGGSLGGSPGGSASGPIGSGGLPPQIRKCVPADGTGDAGDFCTQKAQCKSLDCAGTVTSKKCAAVSTPKKANASSCSTPTDCLSNTCTSGKCVPADYTGPMGEYCNAPKQCASQTCTANKCAAPPPTMYDAYGNSMCQRYCSVGTCDLCCGVWTTAETNLLVQGAILCHAAASIWIWAQIACAIGEVSAFMGITATTAWCVGSCSVAYTQPASMNPMSCTLTK